MIQNWSHPTWNFLHTFVEKINKNYFLNNKKEILELLISIMSILPCPTCRIDATNYMKKIKPEIIKNKEHLKKLFFQFHNYVNVKTKKREFDISILIKYENMSIYEVSKTFFSAMYNYKQKGIYMYDSFYRKKVIKNISDYLQNNSKELFM